MASRLDDKSSSEISLGELDNRLRGFGSWLLARSPIWILGFGFFIVLMKTGIRTSLLGIEKNYLPIIQLFPDYHSYVSASIGPISFGHLLGVNTAIEWLLVCAAVLGACLTTVYFLLRKTDRAIAAAAALFFVSISALSTQFIWLGSYDCFVLFGLSLWALAKGRALWIIGALVAASSNPEQMLVGSLALILVTLAPPLNGFRTKAYALLGSSLAMMFFVTLWMSRSEIQESRLTLLTENLKTSILQFVRDLPYNVWGWYGVVWLLVLVTLVLSRSWRIRILLLIGMVVVPALATIVTLDGVRVFAMVSMPIALVLVVFISRRVTSDSANSQRYVGLYAVVFLITPAAVSAWSSLGTPLAMRLLSWLPG